MATGVTVFSRLQAAMEGRTDRLVFFRVSLTATFTSILLAIWDSPNHGLNTFDRSL